MNQQAIAAVSRVCREVLGVSYSEGLPNHYELLALPTEEADSEVVAAACKTQSKKLRSTEIPGDLDAATRLVQQALDRARICLSDPNAQASYLQSLKMKGSSVGVRPPKFRQSVNKKVAAGKLGQAKNEPPSQSRQAPRVERPQPVPLEYSASADPLQLNGKAANQGFMSGPYAAPACIAGAAFLLIGLFAFLFWPSGTSSEIADELIASDEEYNQEVEASMIDMQVDQASLAEASNNDESEQLADEASGLAQGDVANSLSGKARKGSQVQLGETYRAEAFDLTVTGATIGKTNLTDLIGQATEGKSPDLQVHFELRNTHERKIIRYDDNIFMSKFALRDDYGNRIRGVNYSTSKVRGATQESDDILPGDTVKHVELFKVPPPKTEYLVLTVDLEAFGGEGDVEFFISIEAIQQEEGTQVAEQSRDRKSRDFLSQQASSLGGNDGSAGNQEATTRGNGSQPLEGMLSAVSIPSLITPNTSLTSEGTTKQPIKLGNIPERFIHEVSLEVDPPKIKRVTRSEFKVVESKEGDLPSWEVMLVAVNPRDNVLVKEFEEPVASITYVEEELRFEWLTPKFTSVANLLCNCTLRIHHNNEAVPVVFREATVVDKFVLDLTETSSKIPLAGDSLPSTKGMSFQVTDVNLGGIPYHLEPSSGIVTSDDDIKLFLDNAPVETYIRIRMAGGKKEPYISITQRFKFGSRWRGFTESMVIKSVTGLKKSIAKNQRDLNRAKNNLPSLRRELSSVQSKIPRAEGREKIGLIGRSHSLQTKISGTESRINRLSRAIPEAQATLPKIEKLVSIGTSLHNKANFGLRVFVETESGQYDVLKTSGASGGSTERSAGL